MVPAQKLAEGARWLAPTGITVSAAVIIIGSAFTVLCGAMILLGSVLVLNSSRAADAPVNLRYILIIEACVFFGFGAWGLATGIGLIRTNWPATSTLVYAAILVFLCVPAAIAMAIVPLPNTPSTDDPNRPFNIILLVRVGGTLLYAMFAALGGYWLYFFNTRKVKAQFRERQPLTEVRQAELTGSPSEMTSGGFGPDQRARPLSITIIGWYLVVNALAPLSIVFTDIFWVKTALFFLGIFLFRTEHVPVAHGVDDSPGCRGGGIAEIKTLGPDGDHRPAMRGALKYCYDGRHSRQSSSISASHGYHQVFNKRPDVSFGVHVSDVDRHAQLNSNHRCNFIFPDLSEKVFQLSWLSCCIGYLVPQ